MEAIPAPRRVPPIPSLDESAATVNPAKPEAITSVALTSGLSGGSSLGCWWLTTPRLIPNEVLCMCRRLIHRSAWKVNSRKYAVAISEGFIAFDMRERKIATTVGRTPANIATNGAKIRSKQLRLDTDELPENFCVLRTSP